MRIAYKELVSIYKKAWKKRDVVTMFYMTKIFYKIVKKNRT